jgi:hypothetical protein
MSHEFYPYKYWIYNLQQDRDEPQFKILEELPEQYRQKFKRVPNGGYVKVEAVEEIPLAWLMAESEDLVRGNHEGNLNRRIKAIAEKADRQADIGAGSYTAGRARAKKSRVP